MVMTEQEYDDRWYKQDEQSTHNYETDMTDQKSKDEE